jgi:hypothetical protein
MANTMAGHRRRNLIFIGTMVVVVAVITVAAVYSWYRSSGGGVDVQVLDVHINHGLSGTPLPYVATGQVQNYGALTSNTIQMQLTLTSDQGTILYTTFFNHDPLGGGERGTFVVGFTSDDLGGYNGSFRGKIKVTSQ